MFVGVRKEGGSGVVRWGYCICPTKFKTFVTDLLE